MPWPLTMRSVTVMASTAWPGSIATISMPRLRDAASSAHMASAQARASASASMLPPSREGRLALLQKSAHPLGVIGRAPGLALEVALEVELGVEIVALGGV